MVVRLAIEEDKKHLPLLVQWYEESAKMRGIGIAKRESAYLEKKIDQNRALIAFHKDELAGFCYMEVFEEGNFVVNSGLIVHPNFRKLGFGSKIKLEAFKLCRERYPNAKIFGITTNLSVMRMNTAFGYETVTFSELTHSEDFWKGCRSCKYHHILEENERKLCLCTAMVFDPKKKKKNIKAIEKEINKSWEKHQKKTEQ